MLKCPVILRYSSGVTAAEIDDMAPVNGLVDNRRAASMLGVSVNTFRVWATRSQTATRGVAAAMPAPVATMHGHVYRLEDIERFGRVIAQNERGLRTTQRNLGAYFTPDDAAKLMVGWAVRDERDVILEPSVGDGQFALAAQQLAAARRWAPLDLHACELDPRTAAQAIAKGAVKQERIHVGDFLGMSDLPMADAVIGNPPYIRVRELEGALQRGALNAAVETMGGPMDRAGSVWMPFVSKSTSQLRRGGRLAFVLPLDFTYVKYARPLWEFLGNMFGRIRILRFRERVFPNISQNVLILLAEQRGGATAKAELIACDRVADLPDYEIGVGISIDIDQIVKGDRAFQYALLPSSTRDALGLLAEHSDSASERAKFNIGYVSGNKRYFHPSAELIEKFRLPQRSLRPTIATSRQLSGAGLKTSRMSETVSLWLPENNLTKGERQYIYQGEDLGIDMGYKCRIRTPWYKVPGVRVPDVLLTTFSDRPRLHLNDGGWVGSNSVLCGFVRPGEIPLQFVGSWYSPLTMLSTELHIHSLGGGVMIAVPREADSVRILDSNSTRIIDLDQLDHALRSDDLTAAYAIGSESVRELVGSDGLAAIWEGSEILMRWRKAQAEQSLVGLDE